MRPQADLSWGELRAETARVAAGLRELGVERGDRVAVMCGNRVELLEVFLGCGWIGAVSVPVNTAAMGPQIEYLLADSGARLLVIERNFVERLALADLDKTSLQSIWIVEAGEPDAATSTLPRPRRPYSIGPDTTPPADVFPGDTLAILYTSGTTGPAKGVTCPHAQFHAWGENTARILGVTAGDVLCTTLPLFHINALNTFAQAALCGARVVFEPRFSASGFWPAMQAANATVVYLLGAMVPILLSRPEVEAERTHRIRVGLGPGVPVAAALAFRERTGIALIEGYGSTETNFVIATTIATPCDGRMGWPQPGFDARVVGEHDAELADGSAGELVLRADVPFSFASGYFNRPRDTVQAWRNLWFHTGDRVVRDADGAFRFVDRLKDSIRRRGENISSYEVEQALLGHPAVAAAAVYPVQCELGEDEVMAALVAHAGCTIDAAELARHCESRLPRFAIPRYIDVLADLPRTENGKVQKYRLRERGVGAETWDRAARHDAAA
ncbi:MAG: ATP-dependent acyl-CoA ligase [Pseudomonadota bacterium]|nr:ATP-dependent acyl-CoA ligase [Pseudomonadota bacterium]